MEYIALFIVGLLVGVISSFFGVGGGVIIVPTLLMLFPKLSPAEVIAISLLTIMLSTAINNYHFYKKGFSPSTKTIIIFIIFCIFGAFSGGLLVTNLEPKMVKKIFGAVLLLISLKKLLIKNSKSSSSNHQEPPIVMAISSLAGSFLAALTGLGGGVIYVPLFQNVAKISVKRVSAFSNMAMMIGAALALIPHMKSGSINLNYALILFAGSFLTSKLGMKLDDKVSSEKKNTLFSIMLLLLSIKILY